MGGHIFFDVVIAIFFHSIYPGNPLSYEVRNF